MTRILHSGRTVTDALVAFDIRWDGDLAEQTSVLWSMLVTSADGQETVRLAYRSEGAAHPAQFVDDQVTARRREVEPDADVGTDEITVRFPADVVGVAAGWPTWRAVVTVDGADVAEDVSTH